MSVADFDDGVAGRYFRETPSAAGYGDCPLIEVAAEYWGLSALERDEFQSELAAVLSDGDFNFVVVSQNYRDSVVTSAGYLNATSRAGRFHLVQMTMLSGREITAYPAQIVATSRAVKSGTPSPQAVIDEAKFLSAVDSDAYRSAIRDLFASLRSMGIKFGWGSRGTSQGSTTPTDPNQYQSAGPFQRVLVG